MTLRRDRLEKRSNVDKNEALKTITAEYTRSVLVASNAILARCREKQITCKYDLRLAIEEAARMSAGARSTSEAYIALLASDSEDDAWNELLKKDFPLCPTRVAEMAFAIDVEDEICSNLEVESIEDVNLTGRYSFHTNMLAIPPTPPRVIMYDTETDQSVATFPMRETVADAEQAALEFVIAMNAEVKS